jgi:hypothetical protein
MGLLVGLIVGVLLGIVGTVIYINQNPPVYQGGAYPNEMTTAYQKHYLAMVIDSYIVNQEPQVAQERLKSFETRDKIQTLGERSASYVAAGRASEAQLINDLAVSLKQTEGWDNATIEDVVRELTVRYQSEPARAQGVGTLSAALLDGLVPYQPEGETPPAEQPAAPQPGPASEASPWFIYLLCCLFLLVLIVLAVLLLGRRQISKAPPKPAVEWEGEGPAPLKAWSGTYTLGDDLYDEFFTIETEDDDFLGECGMAIMDSVSGTSPKQVMTFDVGLFDKTDITTRSQIIMSEFAYNDETLRGKVEANPQAEALLAEPGKEFSFESTAMRVEGKIEEMEYGEGENKYFAKLKVGLNLFVREGADLKKGEMDVPDQFK